MSLAIYLVFAANGAIYASWISRLPAVRDRLGASEPEIGLAILGLAAGAIVSMPSVGRLCDRFGVRRVLLTAMLADLALFPLVAWVPSVALLGVVLLAGGVAFGAWDVSMNAAAHAHETSVGRALMPRFHAAFSGGALVGAGLGAVAAAAGVPVGLHLATAGVLLAVAAVVAIPLIPDRTAPHVDEAEADAAVAGDGARRRRGRLTVKLVLIGLMTACATLGEGAAADWGPLFLHDEREASEGIAAAGYAAFALAMTIGRAAGTGVLERLGRVRALRTSGLLVAGAVAVTLSVPLAGAGIIGMVAWGLGVALVFPAAMSAAAEAGTTPAYGIGVVSTIGYGGFVIGPPLVGFLAGWFGLGVALWAVSGMGIVLAALAPAAAPPEPRRPDRGVPDEQLSVAKG
jgi:MFS family permease